MIHNYQGHQEADSTIYLCWKHPYWQYMYKDVAEYVYNHSNCKVLMEHYTGTGTKPSSLIAHNPFGLVMYNLYQIELFEGQ